MATGLDAQLLDGRSQIECIGQVGRVALLPGRERVQIRRAGVVAETLPGFDDGRIGRGAGGQRQFPTGQSSAITAEAAAAAVRKKLEQA